MHTHTHDLLTARLTRGYSITAVADKIRRRKVEDTVYYHSPHLWPSGGGWALITRPGTKASRLTSTKWNEGSPVGRGNPSSMCICVPRNGIISSVRHWILDPPLSIIVRSEKLAIIYPRHLSVFRASQIFEVLFIVSPNCPICKPFRSLFFYSFVRREIR